MGNRGITGQKLPTIRKRIRCHIDDAHNQGAIKFKQEFSSAKSHVAVEKITISERKNKSQEFDPGVVGKRLLTKF